MKNHRNMLWNIYYLLWAGVSKFIYSASELLLWILFSINKEKLTFGSIPFLNLTPSKIKWIMS